MKPGIPGGYLSEKLESRFNLPVLAQSARPENHHGYYGQVNGFMQAVHMAWAQHLPLRIRPDDIWLLILQGLCIHVNNKPEKHRKKLVYHMGKMPLTVEGDVPASFLGQQAWERMIKAHTSMAQDNCTPLAKSLLPKFSTSAPEDQIAFQGTFLHLVKAFFRYEYDWVCGIPQFELLGTVEDYKTLFSKLEALKDFGLQSWSEELRPIIEELICAKEGSPNIEFWRNVYQVTKESIIFGSGCYGGDGESDYITQINGHFVAFFPYLQTSKNVYEPTYELRKTGEIKLREIPVGLAKYEVDNVTPFPGEPTQFHVYSGFLGTIVCNRTFMVSPQIGWVVTPAPTAKGRSPK
jgi:hypothetical protein